LFFFFVPFLHIHIHGETERGKGGKRERERLFGFDDDHFIKEKSPAQISSQNK